MPASGNFCHLLIAFANSLDPDQAQQNIGPDLLNVRIETANTDPSLPLHTMIKINNACMPSIHFLMFHANSIGSCENEQMHMFI